MLFLFPFFYQSLVSVPMFLLLSENIWSKDSEEPHGSVYIVNKVIPNISALTLCSVLFIGWRANEDSLFRCATHFLGSHCVVRPHWQIARFTAPLFILHERWGCFAAWALASPVPDSVFFDMVHWAWPPALSASWCTKSDSTVLLFFCIPCTTHSRIQSFLMPAYGWKTHLEPICLYFSEEHKRRCLTKCSCFSFLY